MSLSTHSYLWSLASCNLQYSHVLFFGSIGVFLLYVSGAIASVSPFNVNNSLQQVLSNPIQPFPE
jgi:hypothetical protein